MKEALSSAPVLNQPDFKKPFTIQCDASSEGIGGVLFQLDDDGNEKPIAYMSKKLNKAQRNYTVTELECLAAVLSIRKFRAYVEGSPFRVITDHSSLKWLMSLKDLSGRLARWSLELQGYDFCIEHRKGALNVVPDTLSRVDMEGLSISSSSCELKCEEISFNSIPIEVDLESIDFEAESYSKLRKSIIDNQEVLPDLVVSGKYVYKRIRFRDGQVEEDSLWRLWLPETLTQQVVKSAHDTKTTLHSGFIKTYERIREKYYWPQMALDIKRYVNECEICKAVKAPNITLRAPIVNQTVTERPMQRLYIDLLGPYPRTKNGNVYIFIVLDHFTKFIFLKALSKATSAKIVTFLESEIFHKFGTPEIIHSDNGRQFIAKDFQALLNTYGIRHQKTALYSPQANNSERVNRSILSKLRIVISKEQNDWDVHLSSIACSLRSDRHDSIKCQPYYALFGQNMVLHASTYKIMKNLNALTDGEIMIRPKEAELSLTRQRISANLRKAHTKSKNTYNLRARTVEFKVGQEVFHRNFAQSNFVQGLNAKFMPKFLKSRIRRAIGSCLYELETREGKLIGVFHSKDIRQ